MFQKIAQSIANRTQDARDRAVHAKLSWAVGWLASAQAALRHHIDQAKERMAHHDERIAAHQAERDRHAAAIASAATLADNLDKLQTVKL